MFNHKTTALATTALAAALAITVAGPSEGSSTVPISACGQTVTTNAILTKDLICAGSNGINVAAAGITIDLKEFTISGDLSPGHSGIDDGGGYDGLAVKNGVLRNFAIGMFAFNGADHVSLSNLAASGNIAYGIYIGGASASVKSSTVAGNAKGVQVDGDSATVQSLTASRNSGPGILINGDSAKIQSSTAAGNGATGIVANGASGSISSSTASGNSANGIIAVGAAASVKSSTASGNGQTGMTVGGASASVKSSTASGNGQTGIVASGASVSVSSSTASGNMMIGITVSGDAAVITGDRAETNGFFGGSDLKGFGIYATGYTTAPVGTNVVRGNDDPSECQPASLC